MINLASRENRTRQQHTSFFNWAAEGRPTRMAEACRPKSKPVAMALRCMAAGSMVFLTEGTRKEATMRAYVRLETQLSS